MLSEGRHQVVLCDLEMPARDGMVLLKSVRAGFPDVAVVVIAEPGNLRRAILAMIAGASGYIQAPLERESAAASLRSAMKRKELDSALRW